MDVLTKTSKKNCLKMMLDKSQFDAEIGTLSKSDGSARFSISKSLDEK